MDKQKSYNQNLELQLASQQRKNAHRRTVDHGNSMGRWFINRSLGIEKQAIGAIRPEASYLIDLLPPAAYKNRVIVDQQTKFVHLSANKAKHAIHAVKWTPEGRRLLVASHSGEFTLWHGMTFNFETIMQAHDTAIFSLCYSHNGDWLISGDQDGSIKYWQPNFNNVNILSNVHGDGVRDLAFSPNDSKFVSCSDDSSLKIWNFNNGVQEQNLSGHHWDVKCCDWHPSLGLVLSGSKDNLIKLWDPRSSKPINTLHGFKHTVTKAKFQPIGAQRLLAATSRDRSARVFDLRTMKDILIIRNQEAETSAISWHPVHAELLTTASYDGSISHYILNSHVAEEIEKVENTANHNFKIPYAHEKAVNQLEYNPVGNILCSAGADRSVRFWCRSRPNDPTAFRDAPYSDEKVGAWYYGVNNNNVGGLPIDDFENNQEFNTTERQDFPGIPLMNDFGNNANNFNDINNNQLASLPGMGLPGLT
ncbi:hypothetical protein PACTADRAFT_45695 [Pachysolen tannophilus NRRL Y-2460]|uniref:Polyadenylation factor subunit 2 n=1 Tax=Pachysolen tannophilus NRRL Y-2460 TaxID=669874 RepID=A0A1E4TQ85_PACTA|nr:hypothetical protein PACTADRAFT_45695 [Pachysolen tannophilus NRRL Y-2460]